MTRSMMKTGATRASRAGYARAWREPLFKQTLAPVGGGTLLTANRARAIRHALWIVGLFTLLLALGHVLTGSLGFDAHAYWAAWRHHLYAAAPQQIDAYLYSPVFAQVIWPLTLLSWPVFCCLWLVAVAATYVWLLAPLPLTWRIPALLLCSLDIVSGNIWSFFALVLVVGFRFPGAWALPALTKVTPVVGVWWFMARREWRSLLTVLGVAIGLTLISLALGPSLWLDWFRLLLHPKAFAHPSHTNIQPQIDPPTALLLVAELPVAIGITIFAARTDRPWLLPVAMVLSNPVFTANAFVVLAAVPRLLERDGSGRRVRGLASDSAWAARPVLS
jgi:Glycosyltransferase family 87